MPDRDLDGTEYKVDRRGGSYKGRSMTDVDEVELRRTFGELEKGKLCDVAL